MNSYEEFINNFKSDVALMNKISEMNLDERSRYLAEAISRYSKILGFYHSQLLVNCRQNMEKSIKIMVKNRENRMSKIIEYSIKDQLPYVDEFINDFNFYYGIISGHLIAGTQNGSFDFRIVEEE
jgi:hypothetical protein